MYEEQTFRVIINRMLDRFPNSYDKREGHALYDALAPAAYELYQVYKELDYTIAQQIPLTSDREHLILMCETFGLFPTEATHAILQAHLVMSDNSMKVPNGTRFYWQTLTFQVIEHMEGDLYMIECEQTGTEANEAYGIIVPIINVPNLRSAKIVKLLVPGEDVEDTEALRKRFLAFLNHGSYGGNEEQYVDEWVKPTPGVGGCKVIRCPEGVKSRVDVYITDSEWNAPSQELIELVQEKLQPVGVTGLPEIETSGLGLAPIAHVVTVKSVLEKEIDVGLNITYRDGYNFGLVKSEVEEKITGLFKDLISKWDSRDNLLPFQTTKDTHITLSVLDINYILHDIEGIIYYEGTTINDSETVLELEFNEIPVLGEVTDGRHN